MEKAQVIVRYGIGVDNVDLKAAAAKKIPVCNVPDYCIDEVADHTLALILAGDETDRPVRERDQVRPVEMPVPISALRAFKNMTVGIVAFGRIGREVANRLKPFKCRLWSSIRRCPPRRCGRPATSRCLDELAQSDLLACTARAPSRRGT